MVAGSTTSFGNGDYGSSFSDVREPEFHAVPDGPQRNGYVRLPLAEDPKELGLLGGKKQETALITKRKWIVLITLAFGHFCVGASISLQAPFFPYEAELKGTTPTQYGFVFSIYELTIFIVAPLFGKVVALVRPKFMLLAGLFWVGSACIVFGWLVKSPPGQPFFIMAVAIRALEGLGTAGFQTAVFTIVAAEFPERVATIYSIQQTVFGAGLVAGPTVGGALYQLGGFATPFVSIGALLLISALIIHLLLPPPDDVNDVKPKSGELLKFWWDLGNVLNACCIFVTFLIIGFNATVLEPHMRQFNLLPAYVGLIFVLNGTVYSSTAWIWGRLADKTGWSEELSVAGCCLLAISLLLLGPAPFFPTDTKLWMIMMGLAIFGFGSGGTIVCGFVGSLRSTLARGFPDDLSTYGLVSSLFTSSHSMGAFVGPTLGGFLFEHFGYRWGSMVLLAHVVLLIAAYSLYIGVRRCSDRARVPLVNGSR